MQLWIGLFALFVNAKQENPYSVLLVQKGKMLEQGIHHVKNLEEFKMLGAIPTIPTGLLSYKGQSLQTYLLQNNGSWHKTCREMFSNTKLERAKKR